jgi:alpha-beta hydrolase superfamily lysophospholipase
MPERDSTLSPFTAGDGENLAVQFWPTPPGLARRGIVVLVHGLGEHAGRYDALARRLAGWGFAVLGYDQCGHGKSAGARGRLPNTMRLIEDLNDIIQSAQRRLGPGQKLVVLGHSLGALVTCVLVLLRDVRADALVLSSPAFSPALGTWQKLLLRIAARFAPDLTLGNGIAPEALSHDPEVVDAYKADPLVHDRISGRLANFVAQSGPRVLSRAPRWRLPTLLLYGGSDCVVDPAASRAFAQAAPPGLVTAHCLTDLYHEVFNEADAEPVFEILRRWLDERVPLTAPQPPRGAGAAPATPSTPRRPPPARSIPSSEAASPGS